MAIMDGQFGPQVFSAKVSVADDSAEHVIYVYNQNYLLYLNASWMVESNLTENRMMASYNMIRELDINCTMVYRPDIFTYLGIYKGNPWGIKPSLMTIMSIDGDSRWTTFVVPDSSSDIPVANEKAKLETFLSKSAPSKLKKSDGIEWISIVRPDANYLRGIIVRPDANYLSARPSNIECILSEWNSCQQKDLSYIHYLAEKHGKLTGKWMPFVSSNQVDQVWGKIARAIFEGRLGPHVSNAKVSPVDDSRKTSCDHVICVYNPDYLDDNQVMEIEKLLRKIGVTCRMSYKPDIFTLLAIYNRNPWGIKPTLYDSNLTLSNSRNKRHRDNKKQHVDNTIYDSKPTSSNSLGRGLRDSKKQYVESTIYDNKPTSSNSLGRGLRDGKKQHVESTIYDSQPTSSNSLGRRHRDTKEQYADSTLYDFNPTSSNSLDKGNSDSKEKYVDSSFYDSNPISSNSLDKGHRDSKKLYVDSTFYDSNPMSSNSLNKRHKDSKKQYMDCTLYDSNLTPSNSRNKRHRDSKKQYVDSTLYDSNPTSSNSLDKGHRNSKKLYVDSTIYDSNPLSSNSLDKRHRDSKKQYMDSTLYDFNPTASNSLDKGCGDSKEPYVDNAIYDSNPISSNSLDKRHRDGKKQYVDSTLYDSNPNSSHQRHKRHRDSKKQYVDGTVYDFNPTSSNSLHKWHRDSKKQYLDKNKGIKPTLYESNSTSSNSLGKGHRESKKRYVDRNKGNLDSSEEDLNHAFLPRTKSIEACEAVVNVNGEGELKTSSELKSERQSKTNKLLSIFREAKPVDLSVREKDIEQKLRMLTVTAPAPSTRSKTLRRHYKRKKCDHGARSYGNVAYYNTM